MLFVHCSTHGETKEGRRKEQSMIEREEKKAHGWEKMGWKQNDNGWKQVEWKTPLKEIEKGKKLQQKIIRKCSKISIPKGYMYTNVHHLSLAYTKKKNEQIDKKVFSFLKYLKKIMFNIFEF